MSRRVSRRKRREEQERDRGRYWAAMAAMDEDQARKGSDACWVRGTKRKPGRVREEEEDKKAKAEETETKITMKMNTTAAVKPSLAVFD